MIGCDSRSTWRRMRRRRGQEYNGGTPASHHHVTAKPRHQRSVPVAAIRRRGAFNRRQCGVAVRPGIALDAAPGAAMTASSRGQLTSLRIQSGLEQSLVEFPATLLVERIVIRVRSLMGLDDCQCEPGVAESRMKFSQSFARCRGVSDQRMSSDQVKVIVPKIRPHSDGSLKPRDSIPVIAGKKVCLPNDPIENTDRRVT